MLVGCDQNADFDTFIPKREAAIAKTIVSQVAAENYEAVEKQMDTSIKKPSVHGALQKLAAKFPTGEPTSINTVGARTSTTNGVTSYQLTFEYNFPNAWLLANVILRRNGNQLSLLGLQVSPLREPLKEYNHFTFSGKGLVHYAIFLLAAAIPVFIAFTLILCLRTKIARRKWLWLLFVAFGIARISFNWTNGAYNVHLFSIALLGAGYYRPGPYGSMFIFIAFPLGAAIFLLKRRSLGTPNDD